ncbi:glycoside hydrolase family 43 protein [Hymenobacter monticola]|uniref:Glycoside hydrolase family 43 protein n=1 Tax=Hymenobacter monticola TaxID=1705399 RepID=A0ABY4BBD5_9BACT|nr:glycoside hydrolase family 43 protein [Hymenobacter monticola]UOE36486.1 glycoside hydrolase family 43 protein [Hymenobacter monticola]
MKLLRATLLLLLMRLVATAQPAVTYHNPVLPGFYPDPSVCRVGNDFYLVTSSFEYYPGVPIFHSTDLVNWEQIGHVLNRPSQLPLAKAEASLGIFAPTIRYHDGIFYVVSTNILGGWNFLVTAKNPAGPWSEPVWIKTNAEGGPFIIDPSLFFEDDGKAYLTTTGRQNGVPSIQLAEIDVKTGRLLTQQTGIWPGTGGRYPEGPHLYKKDGWYYLLIAEGGTEYGHKVTIARSKVITGPYVGNPANPILTHAQVSAQDSPVQGVGHADLVQAPDNSWWLVALGFRPIGPRSNHHILGRETFLAPVSWPAGEWPVVNGNGTLAENMTAPTLPLHPFPVLAVRDNFDAGQLGFAWNYLRNPAPVAYSLTEKKGFLRLLGNNITLDSTLGSPTFVGRRQQHYDFTATTSLDFTPRQTGQEAGLTVLLNNRHHYEVFIRQSAGQRRLVLAYTLGRLRHLEKEVLLAPGPVQLRVTGTRRTYAFSYAQGRQAFKPLGTADTYLLSTETAGGNTGVLLGLYATAAGAKSTPAALFDWFDYAPASPAAAK